MSGILFCIENPLLDISAEVDEAFLQKYDLKSDDAILAEPKHAPLYTELVEKFPVQYIAGGACQNSARVAQWILPEDRSVIFVGCVGKDENGKKLKEVASGAGVHVEYLEDEKVPTGVCAALVNGKHRSLVTDLQAANAYKIDHLERPEIWSLVEKSKYIYVGGFFLTVSPPSIQKLAKHAAEADKVFVMNLSAPFISQFFQEPLFASEPYWDYIIGNETEAAAFAKAKGFETEDLKEIALKVAALPKVNTKRSRVVIITHGSQPTIVAVDGKVTEYPVLKIDSSLIVDTIGAGDAFVGGFLSQLVQEKDLETSIKGGQYAASIIIQHSGCSYPKEKPQLAF